MARFQLEGWDAIKEDLPPYLRRIARIDGRYEWGYSVVGRAMLIGILGFYLPYALYELNEVALQLGEITLGPLEFEVNHRIIGDPRVLFQTDFQGVNITNQINEFLNGSIQSCLGFSEGGAQGYSPIDALAAVCNRQEIHQILEQLYYQYSQWIAPENQSFHELVQTYIGFELEQICGPIGASGSPFGNCTIFEMKQVIYDGMLRLMRMTPFDRKDLIQVFQEMSL